MFRQIEKLKALYPLVTIKNEEILRRENAEVTEITSEIKEFAMILLDLMWEYDGVGLAAPQINRNIKMCAVTFWKEWKRWRDKENIWEEVLINPEIIDASENEVIWEEACLSVPNKTGNVARKDWVVIRFTNIKWQEVTKKLKGFNAIIVQHEIDHLNGILFTDKVIK